MVPTIKPPPQVEDSHVSNSLWTPTETETDSASSPCPVCRIQPTLPVLKVILYSKPPPAKPLPWTAPLLTVEDFDAAPTPTPPLEDIILWLHGLIYNIALPTTGMAKTTVITIKALQVARSLAASACMLLLAHHEHLILNKVSTQLNAITAHLAIPVSSPLDGKRSYAATLALGTGTHPLQAPLAPSATPATSASQDAIISPPSPPHHGPRSSPNPRPMTLFDLTLTQRSRASPVFSDLPNDVLINKIVAAMQNAGVLLENRPHSPGPPEGIKRIPQCTPFIRVVGWHRSGDIWIATRTKHGCDRMVATVADWLPKLSDQLCYTPKTYPVIVCGVPAAAALVARKDLAALIVEHNLDVIVWLEALKWAEFLGSCRREAAHGVQALPTSIVLHFADPATANESIDRHIVICGKLLPTANLIPPPPMCYNCQGTGHLAHSCKMATRCGLCAGNHVTVLQHAAACPPGSTPPPQMR